MRHSIRNLGRMAAFLLPSVKLKHRFPDNQTTEEKVHRFLLDHFDGYTQSTSTVFSFAVDGRGREHQGEYREFKVAFADAAQIRRLADFLGVVAKQLDEPSIYIEIADDVSLIYPTP